MVFDSIIPSLHNQTTSLHPTSHIGIILSALGTPDKPTYHAVRRYLSEFLSDRRTIETHPLIWQPLLQGVILLTHPITSSKAYRRIWNNTKNESPLRLITRKQAEYLTERMAPSGVNVTFGMRYGTPSLKEAIYSLIRQGCQRILCMPLYPQYSATSTATTNDQIFRILMQLRHQPAIRTLPSFADHPHFITALAYNIRTAQAKADYPFERIIASFHGLPQTYVDKGDPYPNECLRTVQALRSALDIDEIVMPITYQSRFGRHAWLTPYTAPFIQALPAQGIKHIAVITPGFMADCLETLDEIGHEIHHLFLKAGGKSFTLIPCLNASTTSIDLLETLARNELAGWIT